MINNDLDLERWRRELQTRGHLQIPDFLQGDAAEMIRRWTRRCACTVTR